MSIFVELFAGDTNETVGAISTNVVKLIVVFASAFGVVAVSVIPVLSVRVYKVLYASEDVG